jgi:CP family cyanate transporter-like MFS transporter
MAALAAGALVRVLDGPPVLFAGTVIAGGAIAIGNVLLPR